MAQTTYPYSIASDFPGSKIDRDNLIQEIRDSAIVIALEDVVVDADLVEIIFRDALSAGDKTILDGDTAGPAGGLIAEHDNIPTPTKVEISGTPDFHPVSNDALNAPVFSPAPRPATAQYIDVTHNWADKTTWWPNAAKKEGQALTREGLTKRYFLDDGGGSPVPFWIDAMNHKIYREYSRHKKRKVRVYDNGVEVVVATFGQTKESPGVDCDVDFVAGVVEFGLSYTVTGPVTADFYHVDPDLEPRLQSLYTMLPPVGYKVLLERVEVQFTDGIDINDDTVFTAFLPLNYIAVQTDATLDPNLYDPKGAGKIREGMAFLITDKDNLHANFGVIPGLENNDIVFCRTMRDDQEPDGFVVWFDASEESSASAMNLLIAPNPFPTIKTWNGTSWGTEGLGAPTKHELPESRDCYSSFRSYLDDATGNYPHIPAGFSAGPRGCPHRILQIPFNWLGSKLLDSSLGVELCVWLESGKEFGPDRTHFSTASFYGQIHNDG